MKRVPKPPDVLSTFNCCKAEAIIEDDVAIDVGFEERTGTLLVDRVEERREQGRTDASAVQFGLYPYRTNVSLVSSEETNGSAKTLEPAGA